MRFIDCQQLTILALPLSIVAAHIPPRKQPPRFSPKSKQPQDHAPRRHLIINFAVISNCNSRMFSPPVSSSDCTRSIRQSCYMDRYLCTIDEAPSSGSSRGVPSVVYTYYLRHMLRLPTHNKGESHSDVPGSPSPWVEGTRGKSKWRRAGKREQRE